MNGTHGRLTVELYAPVVITSVTIEHVASKHVDNRNSALKEFEVYGLGNSASITTESVPTLLLKSTFIMTDEGEYNYFQNFPSTSTDIMSHKFVTLNIINNYGNENYTCLYGFRVHGYLMG